MSSVSIAGMWELGWNTPISEIELWHLMLRDFGVDKFYMTPVSGIKSSKVIEMTTLEDIIEANKDKTIVYVDERSETELSDFKHPENALYVFGKANYSPFMADMKEGDMSVKIKTIENKGLLWPHQAASIVLYDRIKTWQ